MTDPSTPSALATALAYHQAWASQHLDRAMSYIADGIICDAPGASRRHRERPAVHPASPAVCSQVTGQLPVPVAEHRPQQRGRNRGADPVGHPGRAPSNLGELVHVAPGQNSRQRPGGQLIGEPPWWLVSGWSCRATQRIPQGSTSTARPSLSEEA